MTARFANSAALVKVLVYYDGPQMVALKSERGFKMLAVAVQRDGMDCPFFGCELRDRTAEQYFAEQFDLSFALKQAVNKTYYFFDLANSSNDDIALVRASREEAANYSYWPAIGFFASGHDNPFATQAPPLTTTRTFKIDGKWAAPDFSRFHGKMSELYALFSTMDRLNSDLANAERNYFSEQIMERFWEGGGSYGGFFDSLESRNNFVTRNPLEIQEISYASPGTMVFRGSNTALTSIDNLIVLLDKKYLEFKEEYRALYGVLKKEKLLSAKKTATFSNEAARVFARDKTRAFAIKMGIENVEEIYVMCGRNALIFAKVILSIFRRAEQVYLFHAEGRIQS